MSENCTKCKKLLTTLPVHCDGGCKSVFHLECVNISRSTLKIVSEHLNLRFICEKCICYMKMLSDLNEKFDAFTKINDEKFQKQNSLIESLQKNIDGLLTSQKENNTEIKNSILQNNVAGKSFADVLKKQVDGPIVIIKPKDGGQQSDVTKKIVMEKINPMVIPVNSIRSVSKGSVVMKCQDSRSVEQCKKSIEDELGLDYEVTIPKQKLPAFKIVGLTELPSPELLLSKMKAQNSFISSDAQFTVTELKKKNNKIFASLRCDCESFKNIMANGKLLIGWDSCRVFEHFSVLRCFNCCGYHHTSKECKNKRACPKCSLDHDLKDCNVNEVKCINCVKSNERLGLSLETTHAGWSRDCAVYKRKVLSESRKIKYLQ
jgi:hypothetical protein